MIAKVRDTFPDIQRQLPPGLEGDIAYDATKFIEASIREVVITLLEAALIVIAVIFLFLGNLRSTLIPIVTIPLSLIGVMFALLALGYSINLLTLLALVLAIGLVVDDAIVVVENIHRHIEEGAATVRGRAGRRARDRRAGHLHDHHAGGGLCADRLRLRPDRHAVPRVRLHAGRRGRRLRHHRADAVADDGLQAAEAAAATPAGSAAPSTASFDSLRRRYDRRLNRTLDRRPVTLLTLAAVMLATGIMYITTQKELAPEEDQGFLISMVQVPATANLDYLEQATRQVRQGLRVPCRRRTTSSPSTASPTRSRRSRA